MHISVPGIRHALPQSLAPERRASAWLPPLLLLSALVFGGTTLLITQTSIETAAGYEVERLEGLRAMVERDNQRLEAEVAALKSLDRIEREATTRLGMVKPKSYIYVTVDVLPPARALEEREPKPATPEPKPWWDHVIAGLLGRREG